MRSTKLHRIVRRRLEDVGEKNATRADRNPSQIMQISRLDRGRMERRESEMAGKTLDRDHFASD